MKYYLIAGEASGDLHASRLMAALKEQDPAAEFRYFGGDAMMAQGGTLVRHYKELAYMGFVQVVLHAHTILRGMKQCKDDLRAWQPDALILVDYPGFNLRIARYVHDLHLCPVFYYISPKIWAWKERRIKEIRRNVDCLLSILPFEVDYFKQKHNYDIHYVGNPTVDEIHDYRLQAVSQPKSKSQPVIALLPGSRLQEIRSNLPIMLDAVKPYADHYMIHLAVAPSLSWEAVYAPIIAKSGVNVQPAEGSTFDLLSTATAALVTSGTATLETALLRVPQVVCYYVMAGHLASWARRHLLRVPFISLVNLIAGHEVVPELVADGMTADNVRRHLASILPDGERRAEMLNGYEEVAAKLGPEGAPARAAKIITQFQPSARPLVASTLRRTLNPNPSTLNLNP